MQGAARYVDLLARIEGRRRDGSCFALCWRLANKTCGLGGGCTTESERLHALYGDVQPSCILDGLYGA
jgi:hypothetical protein